MSASECMSRWITYNIFLPSMSSYMGLNADPGTKSISIIKDISQEKKAIIGHNRKSIIEH